MPRDPQLEADFRADLGALPGVLSDRPMFGGLCFMLNGNMLGAARQGRAMYRTGPAAEAEALTIPGTEPMVQASGRRMPGYVWLSGPGLADPTTRRRLAAMAIDFTRNLPPKKE